MFNNFIYCVYKFKQSLFSNKGLNKTFYFPYQSTFQALKKMYKLTNGD